MQVARFWRMKKQNYRLEGVRSQTGAVSLQPRREDVIPAAKEIPAEKIRA